MKKIIHHLRRQSEETRIYILHLLTIIAGVILFALWAYSFGVDLSSPETQANLKNDVQPFSALKDNLVEGYNNISQ